MTMTGPHRKHGCSLYWVVADGDEDCFVVARNSRSAVCLEARNSGFDPGDLTAVRVMPVSTGLLAHWSRRRQEPNKHLTIPWYADRWLLTRLGARFRERNGVEETLIDSVVYSHGGDNLVSPRSIGGRYLRELLQNADLQHFAEDKYSSQQLQLFTILGLCLARCHELEFLISHSFVLGGISKRHQERGDTIRAVVDSWTRMTFGQMLRAVEEAWQIDPVIHAALGAFTRMRNLLAHGLTMDEQYSIEDPWGCDELVRFLALFEAGSRPLREVFRGSLHMSLALGSEIDQSPDKKPYKPSRKARGQMALFLHAMEPKHHAA